MDHNEQAHFPLLSRKEAAKYLGLSEQTLAIWKCTKRYDLPCVKIGRLVKYRQVDLDAFIFKNLESTSDLSGRFQFRPSFN